MPIDPQQFRSVMSRFATGITVVTTALGNDRFGITVNAFCSVSLDPPLVLICIEKKSKVHDALIESGFFAANILSADQMDISSCFASNTGQRFEQFCGQTTLTAITGAPILQNTLGYVDCRIVAAHPGGDHTIIVGQVEAGDAVEGDPLLYFGSRYMHRSGE